jgi:release factor glutamine methyltransferase
MSKIYEPREDSFLLEKYVKKFAKGICLDVGTGSGIQAKAASSKAEFVFAVDVNKESVDFCNKIESEKILCLESDLFSFFKKKYFTVEDGKIIELKDNKGENNKFDTIIFNPPYLPKDKKDKDIALDGGKKGYEMIERFLNEAEKFLSSDGIILLIFSSFTGKEKVDSLIEEKGFEFDELEKIHVFFEDIYCYKIIKSFK